MSEAPSMSSHDLHARLGTARAPVLVDVRRDAAFHGDDRMIVGAVHRPPEDVDTWRSELPPGRSVVAYCVHGHEVSQGVAAALVRAGLEAAYLAGGIAGWQAAQLPRPTKIRAPRWAARG